MVNQGPMKCERCAALRTTPKGYPPVDGRYSPAAENAWLVVLSSTFPSDDTQTGNAF